MANGNKNKKGYEKTSLGWLPSTWGIRKLSDMSTMITNGFVGKAKEHYSDSSDGILYLQGYNVSENSFNFNGIRRVSKEFHFKNKKSHLLEGDLLTIQTGDIGLTSVVPKELEGANCHALIITRLKKEYCLPLFYGQFFNSTIGRNRLKAIETGSTMKHINVGHIIHWEIPVPPLPEQQRIADILGLWDKAIAHTQNIIIKLKERNKGLVDFSLKEKDGWRLIKLSDAFERVVRKNNEGSTNVVTISAQRGFIKQSDYFKKVIASEILDKYFLVKQGEFCYNKSYSKGYDWGAIKRLNEINNAVVTSLYICFAIKDKETYFSDFFEHFFDACKLDEGLSKIAHEGGRAHGLLNVTPSDFFSLRIKVPPFEQQKAVAEILSKAKSEVKLYEKKLALFQMQKKGLMQKLLTGEVRVKLN